MSRFLAALVAAFLYLTAQARRAFAFLKTRVAQLGAAKNVNALLDRLPPELAAAMRDPRRFGNRHTRRAMDSLYFRHRSRCRPIMRWDEEQGCFVVAARRRLLRVDVARERFMQALHRIHLRRFVSGRKAERRAVNLDAKKQRRRLSLLQQAVGALDALKAAAEKAGVHFAGISDVVPGRRYYDRVNRRMLEADEKGDLRLVAEGPLEAVVPTQITGLARA